MRRFDRSLLKIILKLIRSIYYNNSNQKIISEWEKKGKPLPPPPVVKQKIISEIQKKFRINTLVETGTYYGDMVYAQLNKFEKIYSIELGEDLYNKALERFEKDTHVSIILGDSGHVLQTLIKVLDSPCIFWLDGHFSGGITARGQKNCPIYEELEAIFTSTQNHIILIDDARMFTGSEDFPNTDNIIKFIIAKKPYSKIEIMDDIIRVYCK
jgi:hypothetical protein